jgi:hypothetical protein
MSAVPSNHWNLWSAGSEPALDSQLRVFVLYTGDLRTLAALRSAAQMTPGLNAHIEVIFPQVVPYPLPIEEPQVAPAFVTSRFKALADEAEIPITIQVCLCRDPRRALASTLPPDSIVVIGHRRRWWRTSESRLGQWLQANGQRVLFVEPETSLT